MDPVCIADCILRKCELEHLNSLDKTIHASSNITEFTGDENRTSRMNGIS